MNVAGDLSRWLLGAAAHLERTDIAIAFGGSIEQRLVVVNRATCSEHFVVRADVDASALLPLEVGPREGAVLALGLVDDGNVRRNLPLLNEPIEHGSRAVGRVGRQPVGLQAKALLRAVDHGS